MDRHNLNCLHCVVVGQRWNMWRRQILGIPKWAIHQWAAADRYSSAVHWYIKKLYLLTRTSLERFNVWFWKQTLINESNIWSVDRTDPSGPEIDHPPWGRSYFIVCPSYGLSCALILFTGLYRWDSMVDIDINPSSMGPIFGVSIGPTLGVPK